MSKKMKCQKRQFLNSSIVITWEYNTIKIFLYRWPKLYRFWLANCFWSLQRLLFFSEWKNCQIVFLFLSIRPPLPPAGIELTTRRIGLTGKMTISRSQRKDICRMFHSRDILIVPILWLGLCKHGVRICSKLVDMSKYLQRTSQNYFMIHVMFFVFSFSFDLSKI